MILQKTVKQFLNPNDNHRSTVVESMKMFQSKIISRFAVLFIVLLFFGSDSFAQTPTAAERPPGKSKSDVDSAFNLAKADFDRREFRKSLERFKTALQIAQHNGEQESYAWLLVWIGSTHAELSEYPSALENLRLALTQFRRLGLRPGEAETLNRLGNTYFKLGAFEKSVEFTKSAFDIWSAIGDTKSAAIAIANIGVSYSLLGDDVRALEYMTRALQIARQVGDKFAEAMILSNMGPAFVTLGRNAEAVASVNQALPIARSLHDPWIEANVLNNLGFINLILKDYKAAFEFLYPCLTLSRTLGDPYLEAYALRNLSVYWREQKKFPLSVFYGKQAVNIIQSVRTRIKGIGGATEKAYIRQFEKEYRGFADSLIEMGRIAEAEKVLGMLKEEEYFDFLRRDDQVANELTSKMSLTPEEQKAFDEYKKYADNLAALGKEYGELQLESQKHPASKFPKQSRIDELDKLLANANRVFNTFLDSLKAQFGENDKRVATVESGTQAWLKELNQPKTVIVSTIAADERLNLIVTTSDTQRAHTVNIKSSDLNKLVAEFRSAVKTPRIDTRMSGKRLYDVLFPPSLQKDLDGVKADTIIWSLDGELRYVPVAALWDGKKYVAERYTTALITLASRDKISNSTTDRTKWQALGVGVSKQTTLVDADGTPRSFEALASVPDELCGVIEDSTEKLRCSIFNSGRNGVVVGKTLLDEEFTLQNFRINLGRYPIVHIASHFSLNAGNENDSYLLLGGGDERKLTLASVRQGGAKFIGIELLTLSACDTAMSPGKKSNGVEIEGFGMLAQNKGAKSVVASLWPVADSSTRDLMIGFYQQLETNAKIGKAEALRNAQLSLLNGKNKTGDNPVWRDRIDLLNSGESNTRKPFKKDPNAPFAHPYYWSPFILIGNWR